MKFTFKEWQKIRHALTIAKKQYEYEMNDSKPRSEDYNCCYQIFKRQAEEMAIFIKRIDSAEM
jgi:hypothetical protein